jgi:hypothetical protein
VRTLDVLTGLLANPDADLPSMGELVSIEPLKGDLDVLYETEDRHGTGMTKNDLAVAVQDSEYDAAEQGAFMQFHKMEVLVESIADKSAKKRHAIICGNPGIGKCLSGETLIKVFLEDHVAESLATFLESSVSQ